MRYPSAVERVRQLVMQTLRELGNSTESGLEETILIRNGFYCGRRFAITGAHAIWFCEENQLKFYGEQGTVLHVIHNVDEQAAHLRPALSEAA